MKASLKKRSMAYLIDILIIVCIASLISQALPSSFTKIKLEKEVATLGESYLAHEVTFSKYIQSYSILSHQLDRQCVPLYMIEAVLVFLYYQIITYVWRGQTIGCKLMSIKINDKRSHRIRFSTILMRNLWMNGFGYFILYMLGLFFLSDSFYLFGITILAIIQILVVIASIFMIKYRRDKRSFIDIVSHSNVIIES